MLEGRRGTSSRAWLSLLAIVAITGGALACLQDPPDPAGTIGEGAAPQTTTDAPASDDEPYIRLPLAGIAHEEGLCYLARIPLIVPNERDEGQTGIRLFEDDVELSESKSTHADIRSLGGGRFSQWGETLYFSTTDGSDPTTNDRRYTIVFPRRTIIDQLNWDFTRIADIPVDAIRSGLGCEFVYDLPLAISGWPSDLETLNGSRLIVLEDGAPLSRQHSGRDAIRSKGFGRYQHYGTKVFFSSSDNSNPRTNGRVYSIALAAKPESRFIDPLVGAAPNLQESLPPPVIEWPVNDEVVADAKPTVRVGNPDPSLLYYWEMDVVPTFDSPNLHRRPRTRETREGGSPVCVIDRQPDFAPQFTPPYRLGALAPSVMKPGDKSYTAMMAARLGYGLNAGADELQEVFAYISNQFYPLSESSEICEPGATWQRDRGHCVSVNYLASRVLADLGYQTRRAQVSVPSTEGAGSPPVSSHSSMEVFLGGRWSIFDPWLGFYLDGVSYQALSASSDQRFLALMSNPDATSSSAPSQPIYLSDYAKGRRYDQFNNWYARYATPAEERLVFSGEPAVVPDPVWTTLWPQPEMQIWVRVRSAKLTSDTVCIWMLPTPAAMNFHPEYIDVSPWTTVSFTIDLAKAYGFEESQ